MAGSEFDLICNELGKKMIVIQGAAVFSFSLLLHSSKRTFQICSTSININFIVEFVGGLTGRPFHCVISGGCDRSQILVAAVRSRHSAVTIHSLLPNVQFHFRKKVIFVSVGLQFHLSVLVTVDC